jgi:hypothetical protein
VKYKTYRPKKLLPKVISNNKPSQKLRDTLFQEEVFSCIKSNIAGASYVSEKKVNPNGGGALLKKERKEKVQNVKTRLLEKYTEQDINRFRSKKERRLEKPKLSPEEWDSLCWLVNQKYPKAGKWEKRKARLLKRRTKNKKTRKFSQYETYINSKEWEQRRNKFWQSYSRRCAICDTAKYIHLHHMHYGNFGNEPDEHLVPLCKDHHAEYHKENGVQRDMIRKTMAFIEDKKQPHSRLS